MAFSKKLFGTSIPVSRRSKSMQYDRAPHRKQLGKYLTVTTVCAAWVFLALIATACGKQAARSAGSGACVVNHGRKSKIEPENSGLTCAQAQSILLVLPNSVGTWPIEGENGEKRGTCRIFPHSAYPLEIRCHINMGHFEVVAVR